MTLYGHLETWLLIGFLAVGAWGLAEMLTAWLEWRERKQRWNRL